MAKKISNLTTQKLYDTLLKSQAELQSMISKNTKLSKYTNEDLTSQSQKIFFDQIIRDKHHYLRMMLQEMYNKPEMAGKLENLFNYYSQNDINPKIEKLPQNLFPHSASETFESFFSIMENNDSVLLDIISFSTIPSLFSMFCDKGNFGSFTDFIGSLKHDLRLKFSRSLFVSPLFLNFTHQAFYPVLRHFYNSRSPYLNDELFLQQNIPIIQRNILESTKKNITYLPFYINTFFKTMENAYRLDSITFLKENFITQMIKNPSMFLIIDPWASENKEFNDWTSKILKLVFNEDTINSIFEIFLRGKDFYDSMIDTAQEEFKYYSYYSIVDSIDLVIFSLLIKKNGTNISDVLDALYVNNTKYELFKISHIGDEERKDLSVSMSRVMKNNEVQYYLYKILKDSPPLPLGVTFDENEDLTIENCNEIFKKYIIDVCNPSVRANIIIFYQLLFEHIKIKRHFNDFIAQIRNGFDHIGSCTFEVENNINFRDFLLNIARVKYNIISLSQNSFYFYITNIIISEAMQNNDEDLKIPSQLYQIANNPIIFNKQWEKYQKKSAQLTKEISGNTTLNGIFYHRFCQNLRFNAFITQRPELVKYDRIVNHYLSCNFDSLFQKSSINKFVPDIIQYREAAFRFKNAFNDNCDPLEKFQMIVDSSGCIYQKYKDIFNIKKDIAAEEFTSLLQFLVLYSNPPHLISNLVYLYEFLYSNQDCNLCEDERYIYIAKNIDDLCEVVNILFIPLNIDFPVNAKKLSRNLLKNVYIIITGDDSSFIANAYQSIHDQLLNIDGKTNQTNINEMTKKIDKKQTVMENLGLIENRGNCYSISMEAIKNFSGLSQKEDQYIIFAFNGHTSNRKLNYLMRNLKPIFIVISDDGNQVTFPDLRISSVNISQAAPELLRILAE